MRSFDGQGDERRIALAERYVTVFGARAPVLDAAEGCYDGVHLLVAVAASGALTARGVGAASARLLPGPTTGWLGGRGRRRRSGPRRWSATWPGRTVWTSR
jgi:hypothetical protein